MRVDFVWEIAISRRLATVKTEQCDNIRRIASIRLCQTRRLQRRVPILRYLWLIGFPQVPEDGAGLSVALGTSTHRL